MKPSLRRRKELKNNKVNFVLLRELVHGCADIRADQGKDSEVAEAGRPSHNLVLSAKYPFESNRTPSLLNNSSFSFVRLPSFGR